MTMSMSDPQASGTPLRPPPRILLWLVICLLCALFAATATPAQTVPASEGPTDGPASGAPAARDDGTDAAASTDDAESRAASDAAEDALEWPHFGLLRSRDLTPFGFLRLDMRPTHAYVARSGRWAFSLDLGYQNTWAVGGAADPYLESLSGRRELSPADWSAITAGGEAFIVDLELAQLDAMVSYWISDRLSVYLIGSGVRYQGGFLDSTIESFHERTGLGDFQRDTARRNDVNILVNLKRTRAEYYSAPVRDGLLDPTIGLRYSFERIPKPFNLIVEIAAKVPLEDGGPRELLSTGVTDWGSQLTLQYAKRRNAFYVSAAVVRTGGSTPIETSRRWLPSAIVGYERSFTPNVSLIVQGHAARSPYGPEDTDLQELRRDKYQVALGLRLRAARGIWSLAINENLENLDNTPDVGVQLGFAFTPRRD
jgi:hypothetical protein